MCIVLYCINVHLSASTVARRSHETRLLLSVLLELAGRVLVESPLKASRSRAVPIEAGLLKSHFGAVALGFSESLYVLVLVLSFEGLTALVEALRGLLVAVLLTALHMAIVGAAQRYLVPLAIILVAAKKGANPAGSLVMQMPE